MRFLLLAALILSSPSLYAASKGALENPQPNDYASGIYLISGWVCDAQEVQILLNGSQYLTAAYGSDRQDTLPVCGDADNGFGVLVNMANLGSGEHQATLIADGYVIATHDFQVAALSTGEFAQDLEGCAVSEDFPKKGVETSLQWTTSMQGFQITGEKGSPTENLEGPWTAEFWRVSLWSYRDGCGPKKLFMYAETGVPNGDTEFLRLAGAMDETPYKLKSTSLDSADREVTLTPKSADSIQLDILSCDEGLTTFRCETTPAGGRVLFTRVPTLLGPNAMTDD